MGKRMLVIAAVVLCLLLMAGASALATTFNSIIAFGDSLSDDGNLYRYTGYPPAPYYEGRFSNGPVWVEYLADTFATSLDNRAFGGATTGYDNYVTGEDYWGLTWQIDSYLATPPVSNEQSLYTIWAGANDFFMNPSSEPWASVENIGTALNQLNSAGANNLLIFSMPDLGVTPEFSADPLLSALATGWSVAFNDALWAYLAEFDEDFSGNLYTVDTFAMFDALSGEFSNTTDAYLPDGFMAGQDPDNYAYWDGIHPTTRSHWLVAGEAARTVAPVPEPSTLLLLGVGLVSFAGVFRRKAIKR